MSGIIGNSNVWSKVENIESLKNLKFDAQGPRHVPIPHYEAVMFFRNQLNTHDIEIKKETIVINDDMMRLMYVAEVYPAGVKNDDYVFSVGFINNNDRSRAFTGIAGTRVFVNNAQMYYCDDAFKSRHTTNINETLYDRSAHIITWFNEFYQKQSGIIEKMKNVHVTDEILGKVVLHFIRNRYALSSTNIKNIVKEFDKPKCVEFNKRTLWCLQNTTAEVFSKIKSPMAKLDAMEVFTEAISNYLD